MSDNGVTTLPAPTQMRLASTHAAMADRLGVLRDLPGFWQGVGFSLIARPCHSSDSDNGIFLQLNMLRETLDFTPIGSPVLNRGSVEDDIAIHGVTYLHRVVDDVSGGALHIEPGMWLTIPAASDPTAEPSIARLATIPHGNAVCTTGFTQIAELSHLPDIPPANTTPYTVGGTPPAAGTRNPYQEFDLSVPSEFRSDPLPGAITQALVDDPNQLLRDALAQQVNVEGKTLQSITRLITSTDEGGVANIGFITHNADTPSMESVFAIETVIDERGSELLQLQYSQTVLLEFNGMTFPHVTVGTLVKAF